MVPRFMVWLPPWHHGVVHLLPLVAWFATWCGSLGACQDGVPLHGAAPPPIVLIHTVLALSPDWLTAACWPNTSDWTFRNPAAIWEGTYFKRFGVGTFMMFCLGVWTRNAEQD